MTITPHDIKSIRKKLGLNADQFAELVGLTGKHRARNVFAWEKGICRPSKRREEFIEQRRYDAQLDDAGN